MEIKGRAKRVRRHTLLTHDQWHTLISDPDLAAHVRTMIFVAMLLGLRVSEILGLGWEDVDFDNRKLRIGRSQVGKHTGDTKTEGSEQELPMHDDLAVILKSWIEEQAPINGWLFGSIVT